MNAVDVAIDPKRYREVLGQYPTGVCVITAMQEGGPIGMVVGSFTSVSLDPPLVAFFPDRNSSTWATLGRSSRFCVNILSAEQEAVCRKLASRDPDKYATMAFELSPNGSPVLDGVVAWIDCDQHSVADAGDHFIVLGLVRGLEIAEGGLPLLFFQGGYGRFAPASLVASDTHGLLTEQLRMVDLARAEMERIAAESGGQCIASTRLGDELIVAASAGQATGAVPSIPVGRRLPFAPPLGSTFAAWSSEDQIDSWMGGRADEGTRKAYRAALQKVRDRGFAVALLKAGSLRALAERFDDRRDGPGSHSADIEEFVRGFEVDPSSMSSELGPAVRMISAPIFDGDGRVVLSLTLQGFPPPSGEPTVRRYVDSLLDGARRITAALGGPRP